MRSSSGVRPFYQCAKCSRTPWIKLKQVQSTSYECVHQSTESTPVQSIPSTSSRRKNSPQKDSSSLFVVDKKALDHKSSTELRYCPYRSNTRTKDDLPVGRGLSSVSESQMRGKQSWREVRKTNTQNVVQEGGKPCRGMLSL